MATFFSLGQNIKPARGQGPGASITAALTHATLGWPIATGVSAQFVKRRDGPKMEPRKLHPWYIAALARPRGVTRLGACYLVAGIITLLAIFSLPDGSDAGPIVSLLLATGFYFTLGISFLSLRRWAYWVALALHVAVALAAPLLLIAQLYSVALINLALNLVACYYLRRPNVRAAFSV